ncbi:MAG: sigma-54-dependent Fis family transcriptional regulator [Myxococcales bacterium]|nr:MAG: sigma-54-dependent Fis family transcriptional regulator [Myxococcales bacterium]
MHMLFREDERRLAAAISRIAYDNPFSPERIASERLALGESFDETERVWSPDGAHLAQQQFHRERPNVIRLRDLSWQLALSLRARLGEGQAPQNDAEVLLYEDLCLYALFARYELSLYELAIDESGQARKVGFYPAFQRDFARLLVEPGLRLPSGLTAAAALAFFFQIRRAFHYIFRYLLGVSRPIAELRAETWHSVFTHDLRRYRQSVYRHMADIPTLIVGPSGTGKDLVAQAIGYSRYLAFDERSLRFVETFTSQYHALNVSALSRGVIESELFGHRRGAFTGALEDRHGWLEACGPDGTVFLDEIGDLGTELQVKFLRVLQTRSFQRIGETKPRMFLGKLVAATHRDLDEGMEAGWFREDLYYRLCADRIQTPSLRERIEADEHELWLMVTVLSERIAGSEHGAALAKEVLAWIEQELGAGYGWPGNVRELEQCVRSVLVRKRYRPAQRRPAGELSRSLLDSGLNAEALLDRYAALVYEGTQSYVETGKRLGLDRRTVKERVERHLRGG